MQHLNFLMLYGILSIKKAPTPKWMLPKVVFSSLSRAAHSVCRRGGHYFFRLFLLSRKASNATINPPKDINNANIPIKTDMVSYTVICATSLPMYSGNPVFKSRETTTLSWILSVIGILTQFYGNFNILNFRVGKVAASFS